MAVGACRHFPPLLRNLVPYPFGNNIAGIVARLFGVHGFAPVLFCFRFHRSTIGIWPSWFKAKERPPTISQGSPGVGCSKMKEAAKHRAAVGCRPAGARSRATADRRGTAPGPLWLRDCKDSR